MASVEVRYLVDNFSVDNPVQVVALFDEFDASASRVCECTVVVLGIEVAEGVDPLTAIRLETDRLERVVGLRVVDVDLDLVDEGEVAQRLHKSRQAINMLVKGERGHGDFPTPFGMPGGRRVWTWAAIARWVRQHKPDWDDTTEPDHLSRVQQRELAAWLTKRSQPSQPLTR
jgi:predicted DNA-binding transcriptional regulator AlpA